MMDKKFREKVVDSLHAIEEHGGKVSFLYLLALLYLCWCPANCPSWHVRPSKTQIRLQISTF